MKNHSLHIRKKLPAFVMLEAMVAIVIVMIIFSLSSLVIINVTTSGMSREKQNAYMLVKALRNETIQQGRYIDESMEIEGVLIEKTIEDYHKGEELRTLVIKAFKGKKELFESKEIVLLTTQP